MELEARFTGESDSRIPLIGESGCCVVEHEVFDVEEGELRADI